MPRASGASSPLPACPFAPALGAARYLELMQMDKKTQAGQLRFILLEGPGRAAVHGADAAAVTASLEAFCG